jgi:hypothetical protein
VGGRLTFAPAPGLARVGPAARSVEPVT